MARVRVHSAVRRNGRIYDRWHDLSYRRGERPGSAFEGAETGRCLKARSVVRPASVLLPRIEKDPAATADNRLESSPFPQNIAHAEPRREVQPSRLPKGLAPRRKVQGRNAVPLDGVRQVAFAVRRSRVYLPTKSCRNVQTRIDSPGILYKGREILVDGKGRNRCGGEAVVDGVRERGSLAEEHIADGWRIRLFNRT